jgi:hypothetical protein
LWCFVKVLYSLFGSHFERPLNFTVVLTPHSLYQMFFFDNACTFSACGLMLHRNKFKYFVLRCSIVCLIISVILKCHVSSSVKFRGTLCTARSDKNSIFCSRYVSMKSQQPLSPYSALTDLSNVVTVSLPWLGGNFSGTFARRVNQSKFCRRCLYF